MKTKFQMIENMKMVFPENPVFSRLPAGLPPDIFGHFPDILTDIFQNRKCTDVVP
jgi:hypothetical protein